MEKNKRMTQLKILELDLETIKYPPYSPDHSPQLIIISFGIWITSYKEKYLIPNKLSKMPSAFSSILALQASMQEA